MDELLVLICVVAAFFLLEPAFEALAYVFEPVVMAGGAVSLVIMALAVLVCLFFGLRAIIRSIRKKK